MGSPLFYLGSHVDPWLGHEGPALFISHRRLSRRPRKQYRPAKRRWALDSGGFSELSMYGEWRLSPADYVAAVVRYDKEIGMLDWAAPQDWMCEPEMIARSGLSVEEHQRRSVANFIELEQLWAKAAAEDPDLNPESPFMPVLQGWQPEDYLRCMDLYAEAGVDLAQYPLVGVGSVCRRQDSDDIRRVFEVIKQRDPDMPLHGFGVKSEGLRLYGDLLASADSMAWSYNARKNDPLPGCSHVSCSNCIKWAMRWRRNVVGPACGVHGDPCDGIAGGCLADVPKQRPEDIARAEAIILGAGPY